MSKRSESWDVHPHSGVCTGCNSREQCHEVFNPEVRELSADNRWFVRKTKQFVANFCGRCLVRYFSI